MDRNLDMPAYEEMLFINHALVDCEFDALFEFALGEERTPWWLARKAKRHSLVFHSTN